MSSEFHIVSWVVALYTEQRASDIADTVQQFLIDSGQVSEVDTWVIHPADDADGSTLQCPWCGQRREPGDSSSTPDTA